MARKYWKQPVSITLDKDVIKMLRDLERGEFKGISRSSVVQTAIIHLHAEHFPQQEKPNA